jgi:hypothetical protein
MIKIGLWKDFFGIEFFGAQNFWMFEKFRK